MFFDSLATATPLLWAIYDVFAQSPVIWPLHDCYDGTYAPVVRPSMPDISPLPVSVHATLADALSALSVYSNSRVRWATARHETIT